LFVDPAELQARYRQSPAWLRALMDSWADGLNFYLATHPAVRPKVLTRFEPWMALSFTEGSIGGDIERISLPELARFYGGQPVALSAAERGSEPREPRGSNGIADRACQDGRRTHPAADQSAHQLLLPLRAPDDERGGAERLWRVHLGPVLHLSGVQRKGRVDAHLLRRGFGRRVRRDVREQAGRRVYRYGKAMRQVTAKPVSIAFRRPDGPWRRGPSPPIHTHHGPIVAARDGAGSRQR
jgi:acyl-homoserine-lactone acylase